MTGIDYFIIGAAGCESSVAQFKVHVSVSANQRT